MTEAYKKLESKFRKNSHIGGAISMLGWDSATMMPSGGGNARAQQIATLAEIYHENMTSSEMADLLSSAESDIDDLLDWEKVSLREMRRKYNHAVAVPTDLVSKISEQSSKCEKIWRGARLENDFQKVAPDLEEMINLVRESAFAKSEALSVSPYDALLDEYDPYNSSENIDAVFSNLEGFLPDFLNEVIEYQLQEEQPIPLSGNFPIDKQEEIGRKLAEQMGFSFDKGRLDSSAHPFSGGIPDDVRMTTRYTATDPNWAIRAIMHETGHALYDQNFPAEWRGLPIGEANNIGMTIHESQSLTYDMYVGCGRPFYNYLADLYKDAFGSHEALSADNLHKLNTRVERSFIRVDADEVTYPIHVILRYRLEQDLISGKLQVKDLPEAWNSMMEKMMGVRPPSDREGCLQDIHWYEGALGYFPTYSLGAMTAAQFFDQAHKDISDLDKNLEDGNFSVLVDWQKKNIHSKGFLLKPQELIEDVTGQRLNPEIYKDHLRKRYLGRN